MRRKKNFRKKRRWRYQKQPDLLNLIKGKKMLKRLCLLLIAIPTTSYGFILENLEVGTCRLNPSGHVRDVNQSMDIGVDRDLHLSQDTCFTLSYSAENLPFIPDFRISYSKLHLHGSGPASKDFQYKKLQVKEGDPISSKWDFENISLTFYYQPSNYFNNDYFKSEIGITTMFVNSTFKVEDNKYGTRENEDIPAFIPTLHLYLEFQPTYYLGLFTDFDGLSFTEQKRKLFKTGIKYYINSQIYFSAGYNYEKIKIRDENSTDADLTTKGYFVQAGVLW